nr:hypothetical protein [Mycobacterium sp. Marseille-P9652]
MSIAPETVHMVLVEGEAAGGVTLDQDTFRVSGDALAAADQVAAAIAGTLQSAAQGGYTLASTGVTWTDPAKAAALRNVLAAHNFQNVTFVSAFTAAATLAQAVGSATRGARTALLFVEPSTAALAVVDSADGSVAQIRQRSLPRGDDAGLDELVAAVRGVEATRARPDGLFLVGSEVDIAQIKPALDAATSLSVIVPEEPDTALARGAALASANARLGAPSTVALPPAEDPVTGRQLAYSAEADAEPAVDPGSLAEPEERRSRKPLLAIVSATVVFVGGVLALAVALAMGIRPHADQRPDVSQNVVAPATQLPPANEAPAAPPPAPESVPPQAPAAPAPGAPAPGPNVNPPRQWLPSHPRDDDDHGADDWLRRHLEHGIFGP